MTMVSSVLAQAILSQQAPDIVGSFDRGRETARKEQTRDLAGIIASGKGTQEQFSELAGLDPQVALTLQQQLGARDLHDTNETIKSANIAYNLATQSSPQAAMEYLNQRGAILSSQGRDTTQTDTIARQFQTDPQGAIQQLSSFRDAVNFGKRSQLTPEERKWSAYQAMPEGTEREIADKRRFGRMINAESRYKTPEQEAEIVKQKTEALKSTEAKWAGKIKANIKAAELAATDAGEAFSDYSRAKAGLPGLREVITNLKGLAPLASNTYAARGWDEIVKQSGFGSTEGATARTKWIGIVNQQVLPLLKATFGGSFTVPEGDSLKATFGDVNSTPEEKMAILEAFIANKESELEQKRVMAEQSRQRLEQVTGDQTPSAPALNNNQPATGGVKFLGFE